MIPLTAVDGSTYEQKRDMARHAETGPGQTTDHGGGDAFVTEIDAAGTAIVFSTFLGGSNFEQALGIALDSIGNVYLAGETLSADLPGVSGRSLQPALPGAIAAFVTKIGSHAGALSFYTLAPC